MRTHASILASVALVLSSCGGSQQNDAGRIAVPRSDAPLCRFGGTWTQGTLRAMDGGFEMVRVSEGVVDAQLDRQSGPLRFRVLLTRDGWHLVGRLDPEAGDGLRVSTITPLQEGVILMPGAEARVLDARPGEVLLGLPRFAPDPEDGFRFTAPVARWEPCDALGFSYSQHTSENPARDQRAALGLPVDSPTRTLAADARASIASRPGGTPFLAIEPREYPQELRVIAEQGTHSRVLVQHWSGVAIVGWLETSSIARDEGGAGGLGILGGFAGPRTVDVCVSSERLDLFAVQAGGPFEAIGSVDPGTRFERGEEDTEGTFVIRPWRTGVSVAGEHVTWVTRASAPLDCVQEIDDPAAGLAGVFGAPITTITITATITAATGAAGPLGGTCELSVQHFPSRPFPCQTQVRCGDRVLYGHLQTNGAFECEVTLGDTPTVRGRDPQTSASSGDGALILDTANGTLEIDDDAQGPVGAFHLEARIDSVRQ